MFPGGQREAAEGETGGKTGPGWNLDQVLGAWPFTRSLCVQLAEEKEALTLEVEQLTQDCNLLQQKTTVVQNQMRELLAERDQVGSP